MIPASCAVVERVALRQVAAAARAVSGAIRTDGARDRAAARERLAADVDHPHGARLVDVREVAHGRRIVLARSRSASCAVDPRARGRARARARGSPPAARAARPAAARAPPRARPPGPSTSSGSTGHRPLRRAPRYAPAFTDKTTTPSRVVDERRLLRDEVEAVHDGVHEQHVELLVGGDRRGEVVGDVDVERTREARPRPPPRPPRSAAAPRRTRGSPAGTDRAARACRPGRAGRGAARAGARNASRPRDDVLRRVGPVDAQDQRLRPRRLELALALEHRLARGQARRTRPGRSRSDARSRAPRPASSPRLPRRRRETRARQRSVWKPTTSLASRPSWIARTIGSGSTDHASAPTQGMCVKWARAASGAARARAPARRRGGSRGRRRRPRVALELLDDRVGEGRVDGDVASSQAGRQIALRLVLQLPEAVLDEPERRIRDDVVVEVVGLGVVRDEPQPVRATRRAPSPRPRRPPRRRGPRPRARSRSR